MFYCEEEHFNVLLLYCDDQPRFQHFAHKTELIQQQLVDFK